MPKYLVTTLLCKVCSNSVVPSAFGILSAKLNVLPNLLTAIVKGIPSGNSVTNLPSTSATAFTEKLCSLF